jgi:copper oxidase (laccase) domain-containing protein
MAIARRRTGLSGHARNRLENSDLPLERFQALEQLGVPHGFVRRVPGIALSNGKETVLANLDAVHRRARRELGLERHLFATARQVHGKEIVVIDSPMANDRCFEGCDGLITDQANVCLGIYVADCCAVFLADRKRTAIGLIHSGKKGSTLGIVSHAIELLNARFGVKAADLIAQLSPCIRPPHYEIDFAAQIIQQCRRAGVSETHDSGICTACDPERYYSYRAEKGRTGRMLALLALHRA